jgi:hypothetical protein
MLKKAGAPLTCVNARILQRRLIFSGNLRVAKMGFKISGNLGDRKPYFRISRAVPGIEHVEVVIDDNSIDRQHASRILRMMADRLLECDWPPDEHYGHETPAKGITELAQSMPRC